MRAATLLLSAALSAALCSTDLPGPGCPAPGVRHLCVGVVDGERVTFEGWHDATGKRVRAKGEDADLDRRMARRHSKVTAGGVLDFGVELPSNQTIGTGPRLRTNDADFGQAWNAATERRRPCPGPEPCPRPSPEPTPDPAPAPPATPGQHLAYILAAALGAAAFFVVLGALLIGLLPRKV